jgi:hypothetical protein
MGSNAMTIGTNNKPSTDLKYHVLNTLVYYDIFNYPLKAKEIVRFLQADYDSETLVQKELDSLCQEKIIFRFDELFSLQNNEALALRRRKGNIEAKRYLQLAKRKAKLIASFPFVRAVMASGSLSKGFMDENSDLDFFIVTEPGRLWIARILLVMYKRIFLFNSHKYFCVNYFIDSEHLEIEEKNLFTATELATVIPLYGSEHYQKLFESNGWIKNIFPNHRPRKIENVPRSNSGVVKKLLENIINLTFPKQLNRFFMTITLRRWQKLYQRDYPNADFQVAFKSKDYASKTHPKNYQRKVMELFEEKLKETNNKVSVSILVKDH